MRSDQRDQAQQQNRAGMSDGHNRAEKDRIARPPCEPTRYAPTNAFPCPGVMACKLPRTSDNKNAPSRNSGENCCIFTNPISADVTIVGLPANWGDGFELERFPPSVKPHW